MAKNDGKAPLYHYRKLHELQVKEIALAIGVKSEVSVFRFENYQRVPSVRTASRIGKLLGKSTGEIVEDYEKNVPDEFRRAS